MAGATIAECEFCGGTGWRPVDGAPKAPLVPCECREQAKAQRRIEFAGIPAKYSECGFANFQPGPTGSSLWRAREAALQYQMLYPTNDYRGLLFVGPPGVGKTHLMVAVVRTLCQKGIDCLFIDYQDLLRSIQNCYNPSAHTTEYQLLEPVLKTEIVAIDDLGNNRISEWVEDTVTYVVNHRYSENLPTLFTANLSEERMSGSEGDRSTHPTFEERLGVRVASRLREMCKFVKIDSPDYRRRAGGK